MADVLGAVEGISGALDMGVLEKATIYILDHDQKKSADYKPIRVQFNPQSYSIRQGVRLSEMHSVNNSDGQTHFTSMFPEKSFLMVQLVFDSYTEYGLGESPAVQLGNYLGSMAYKGIKTGLEKLFKDDTTVYPHSLDVMRKFADLIRISSEKQGQHFVQFIWGPMSFIGKISGMNVEYTMFARNGSPVRANMSLIIEGDEARYMNQSLTPTATETPPAEQVTTKITRPRSAMI